MAKNALFIVVAYDIVDDKRRMNVMNTLLDSGGIRVNYSVFECLLTRRNLLRMKKKIEKIINKKEDNVRYYTLCEACIKLIDNQGTEIPSSLDYDEIIYI
jgi:CRISPR-associated protein Cas2